MKRRSLLVLAVISPVAGWSRQDGQSGPRPPKKDVPYLLHAETLVETESQKATSAANKKQGAAISVPGPTSTARTPLPEPIFLFVPGKIKPEQLGLFRFDVKDGTRQLVLGGKKKHDDDEQKSFHLAIRKLSPDLYRLEASEALEAGEYALSPDGEDVAFCFTVY